MAKDAALVIANGAEGEPASAKDRTLMSSLTASGPRRPAVGGRGGGGQAGVLLRPLDIANWIAEVAGKRKAAGRDRISLEIVASPAAFISGEESAVVSGGRGPRWPSPATPHAGSSSTVVHGRATLVQNVETLAHLALIARHGANWFRGQGVPEEPGTFLATVSGGVNEPGVYEAPYGVRLAGLMSAAGGPTEPLQAILVGGYHGAWVPAIGELPAAAVGPATVQRGTRRGRGDRVAGQCLRAGRKRQGGQLPGRGHGRTCGPCANGLPRIAETLGRPGRR